MIAIAVSSPGMLKILPQGKPQRTIKVHLDFVG